MGAPIQCAQYAGASERLGPSVVECAEAMLRTSWAASSEGGVRHGRTDGDRGLRDVLGCRWNRGSRPEEAVTS